MITPGYLDIIIYQGATFDQTIDVEVLGVPYDLTGYTGTLIAHHRDDDTAAIALTEASGLTLTDGTLGLSMTAAQTAAVAANRYPYQVMVANGGTVSLILEGTIRVVPELTA